MMEPRELKIGHERVFLSLSDVNDGWTTRDRAGRLESFHAKLVLPHLRAEAHVWLSDPAIESNMSDFFADLAENWRGWDGAKAWSTYEGGLALSCNNDGLGHIRVAVALRGRSGDGWLVQGNVPLDSGQLDHLSRDVATFLG